MPFQREWDDDTREFIINRNRTGPPPPPSTGTVRAEDGSIVADSATLSIPPPTPVTVDQPSPFEPVIDANGRITPRWWRFFDQLYRRTGGVVDNINRVPTTLIGGSSSSTVAMTITGAAPSLSWTQAMGAPASMSITGGSIVVNPLPSTGSMAIASAAPTVSILVSVPLGSIAITGAAPTVTSS